QGGASPRPLGDAEGGRWLVGAGVSVGQSRTVGAPCAPGRAMSAARGPLMGMKSFAVELGALYHHGEMLVGKLGEVSGIPLAVALALHLAKLGVRARAWHNIVRAAYPTDRPRFRHALGAFLAGTGVGACVPARAGQLVRLVLLRSRVRSSSLPGLVSTLL